MTDDAGGGRKPAWTRASWRAHLLGWALLLAWTVGALWRITPWLLQD